MKKMLVFIFCLSVTFINGQTNKKWMFNSGLDIGAWWGGTGISSLKATDNPVLTGDLKTQIAYTGDLYIEWLHRKYKSSGPDFGLKTKLVWDYFTANNAQSGNSLESFTLNYISAPVLFEYCISFKNKVTSARYIAPSSTTQTYIYSHSYGDNIVSNTTVNPGGYSPGGVPFSDAIFLYAGPSINFLAKAFHNQNGNEYVLNNNQLNSSYVGFVGGVCLYLFMINIDISYQRGFTSIYNNSNVVLSGFLVRLGFNLSRRKFN
ncbi:MAG: hypothetical protein GTN67_03115 [Hydrotalea flava]|uniref:hypothetical protein n=1 Tax=Hydrotalea TaxID=1004300 RepID=UPI00094388C7|nr:MULTISPECIES: hypothetical protein [Hydrotalea]MBY0349011.1 hypothetical protein [Hydrotalea flava]NIM34458.1 hypothetical protein [Hydrotalea flava]NIM37289.1 hypothetical protein [Hydrotalea flava]NIN02477.1 hypothetical protein [Hydrotalea flava]NIN14134.1 hypothetical protein [Hydrotalea flava]